MESFLFFSFSRCGGSLVFPWLWRNANVGLVGINVLDTYGGEVSNEGILFT
jgi:hypothetical protein